MRWQPWEYQYILIFLFFILSKNKKQFIQLTSLLFVATYFYSGLNKLNGGFLTSTWEHLILIKTFGISLKFIQNNLWIHYLGTLLALFEIFFGLGLLFFINKKIIVLLIAFMHLLILILFGLVFNYNSIILPWNFGMILLLIVLFYNNNEQTISPLFFRKKLILHL
jgi:hypothetical protein